MNVTGGLPVWEYWPTLFAFITRIFDTIAQAIDSLSHVSPRFANVT